MNLFTLFLSEVRRKAAVSIPDEVIWVFIDLNLPGRTVALGSTQSLTEMITRDFPLS
jgi:hypothetical protein